MADPLALIIYQSFVDVYDSPFEASEVLVDVVLEKLYSNIPFPQGINSERQCKRRLKYFALHILSVSMATNDVILGAWTYLHRYFSCSTSRFDEQSPTIHCRLFLISMLVSYKYINEKSVSNAVWSRACESLFSTTEISSMEIQFLTILDYNLMVEDIKTQNEWIKKMEELTNDELMNGIQSHNVYRRRRSGFLVVTPEIFCDENSIKTPSESVSSSTISISDKLKGRYIKKSPQSTLPQTAEMISQLIYETLDEVYESQHAASEAFVDVILQHLASNIAPEVLDKHSRQHLKNFALQVVQKTKSTNDVLLATLTYADRYIQSTRRCFDEAQDYKIHYRLFFIALLTAYKYIKERSVSNLAWSRASDFFFELEEVNFMERMFLSALGYDLVVEDPDTQQEWLLMVQEMTLAASPAASTSSGLYDMTPDTSVDENLDAVPDSTGSMPSEPADGKKGKKGWKSFWSLFKKKALA
ncbi:UNVERIFIED_CONTAM: hypothetical protein HDU68_003462 [Siphonaria sp. JEL0065]|nr:hypothetical protein HDU68_003462 [Siphonaria sp. JEL0065]